MFVFFLQATDGCNQNFSDLDFDKLSWWEALLISLSIGTAAGLVVHFWLGDKIRRHAECKNVLVKTQTILSLQNCTALCTHVFS
jgi:hypothetical protein